MSPPAAWKRRLRCGLVGSWVLMRRYGVRSAMAGVTTASSFAAMHETMAAVPSAREADAVIGANGNDGVV